MQKRQLAFLVGGSYSLRKYSNISTGDFFLENSNIVDSSIRAVNETRNPWKNLTANANFKRSLNNNGREITADLDFIKYSSALEQSTNNEVLYPNKPGNPYYLRAVLPSDINIYSGKVDYVHPLNKETKIEAGAKMSYVSTDNNAPYETFDKSSGKWVDDVRKDHFKYDEQITAGYINFSKQVKKWGFQAGLRGEHTHSEGTQVLIGKSICQGLFPGFSHSLCELRNE